MPQSSRLSIGVAVHKESIALAYVATGHDAEVVYLGSIGTRPCDVAQLVRRKETHGYSSARPHRAEISRAFCLIILAVLAAPRQEFGRCTLQLCPARCSSALPVDPRRLTAAHIRHA